MTRVLVLSDLHLEHDPAWSLPEAFPIFDVAVFAGDVDSPPDHAVRRLADAAGLAERPIVYVPGNHEFYRGCFEERLAAGKAACAGTPVHLLDRDSVVLAGVRFVGAILWTDYRLFGDPAKAMGACRRFLNDHRLIEVGPPGERRLFRPEDAAALHAGDRAFIEAVLDRPFDGPTVVVTHHAPHPGSVAPRFARDQVTAGFASDLGEIIERGRPTMWVHGHVHDAADYPVASTRILANPKGYGPQRSGGSRENRSFDPYLVVEVPVTVRIVSWTLLRVRVTGGFHALGYRIDNGRGRTSSPLRFFDAATRTAVSSSGNRYILVGPPSQHRLDDELVRWWLDAGGLSRHDVEIDEQP